MGFLDLVLGRPLATEEEKAERIGPAKGVPIFGLDALSSAAYGPEAALTILIPLGMAGVAYIVPIGISIVVLLAIVYFSYCQTITAYPQGGGSYTVASENLGVWAGLLAAASLMVDYVLTAAVGISAGVGALISAVPVLQSHALALCLAYSHRGNAGESPGRQRSRRHLSGSHLSIHRLPAGHDRSRRGQNVGGGRTSRSR